VHNFSGTRGCITESGSTTRDASARTGKRGSREQGRNSAFIKAERFVKVSIGSGEKSGIIERMSMASRSSKPQRTA